MDIDDTEDREPEEMEEGDETAVAVDVPAKAYSPREKVIRSLEACCPKLWKAAFTQGTLKTILENLATAANPAGRLELYALEMVGIPAAEQAFMAKSIKRFLIRRNISLLEAGEKCMLEEMIMMARKYPMKVRTSLPDSTEDVPAAEAEAHEEALTSPEVAS